MVAGIRKKTDSSCSALNSEEFPISIQNFNIMLFKNINIQMFIIQSNKALNLNKASVQLMNAVDEKQIKGMRLNDFLCFSGFGNLNNAIYQNGLCTG